MIRKNDYYNTVKTNTIQRSPFTGAIIDANKVIR